MMLAMTDFATEFVARKEVLTGSPEALATAVSHLMGSVRVVIAYGYDLSRYLAVQNMVGLESALLDRLGVEGAQSLLEERKEQG